MSGHLCLKWNNHATAFIKSISSIQIKERYCDATIVCQGKYFPVHRVVLSTCSDYFDEMFERMQCQHPYIVFKDIDPKEMGLLLNYMYQGEVNVVQENLPTLIKAAEALKVKGLAVPDDLPNKESSGRKRGSASNDMPVPKRRSEEKRRRRDSTDQTSHPSTSNQNREKLDDNLETLESKLIKEEPLDTGYNDPPHSTNYGETTYAGDDSSAAEPIQTNSSDNFPLAEETDPYVKQEQTGVLHTEEDFNDEQSSSWSDFTSGDIMQDLPPETSNQDDIYGRNNDRNLRETSHRPRPYPDMPSGTDGPESYPAIPHGRGPDGLRWHMCPHCNYKSITPHNIKKHIRRRHTGERPFRCSVCPKRFSDNSGLQVHLRLHTGEKPYECAACHMKFTYKTSLSRHVRNVHSEGTI